MASQRLILGSGLAILLVISAASIGLDVKSRSEIDSVDRTLSILKRISDDFVIVACGGNAEVELSHTLKLLRGAASSRLVANYSVAHPSVLKYCKPKRVEFVAWAEIKISRRLRPESPHRPPRHRRNVCSTAWQCRFLST